MSAGGQNFAFRFTALITSSIAFGIHGGEARSSLAYSAFWLGSGSAFPFVASFLGSCFWFYSAPCVVGGGSPLVFVSSRLLVFFEQFFWAAGLL